MLRREDDCVRLIERRQLRDIHKCCVTLQIARFSAWLPLTQPARSQIREEIFGFISRFGIHLIILALTKHDAYQ